MKIEFTNQLTGETVEGSQKIKEDGTILVDFPETFSPEEIADMEKAFNDARAQVNRKLQELSSIPFKFLTAFDLKKFQEAERLMAEMSTASVALIAWSEIRPHLAEFNTPFEAMMAGIMMTEKKFRVVDQIKGKNHEGV